MFFLFYFISTTFCGKKPHESTIDKCRTTETYLKSRKKWLFDNRRGTQNVLKHYAFLSLATWKSAFILVDFIFNVERRERERVNDLEWTLLSNMRLQCMKSFSIPFVISFFSSFLALIPMIWDSELILHFFGFFQNSQEKMRERTCE